MTLQGIVFLQKWGGQSHEALVGELFQDGG